MVVRGNFHHSIYLTSLLCLCCFGIFHGEYRLTVPGLACAIPAIVLIGLTRALYEHRDREQSMDPVYRSPIATRRWCCYGVVTSLFFAVVKEQGVLGVPYLDRKCVVVLAVNLVSSAIALLQGGSVLLSIVHTSRQIPLTALIVLAGLTGLVSVCQLQRSYTSNIQLSSYGIILVVVKYLGHPRHYQFLRGEDDVEISTTSTAQDDGSLTTSVDAQNLSSARWQQTILEAYNSPCTQRFRALFSALTIKAAVATGVWTLFLLQNFSDRLVSRPVSPAPVLDRTFQATVPLRIVLSMYEEPLYELEFLIATLRQVPSLTHAEILIYTKSSKVSVEDIKKGTGASQVIQLPNFGREGETYLHHIMSQWDSLANHTLFMQAGIHNRREVIPRLETYFDPRRTGMLSLGFVGHVVKCYGGSDIFGWTEPSRLLVNLYRRTQRAKCDRVLLSYKGQFLVSAARIRGIDQSIYQELHNSLVVEQSSAPIFGFTVERLWSLLFQCSNMEVASKCPSLISGVREGGNVGDCQCLDN